jgi:D-alanyl-D-alanine carboxypeptidase
MDVIIRKIGGALLDASLFFVLITNSCIPGAGFQAEDKPEIPYAGRLQEAVEWTLSSSPEYSGLGISAAVIQPGHRTWTGVSGYSHQDVPITPDMLFDVGSIQKNFEAALVLKMVEEGRLSLDDPVSKHLPAYPNVSAEITIRQLLNHTSGVFNVFEHPEFPWVGESVDYSREWEREQVFSSFVLKPYGPPGRAQHYSSTNYLLLTWIIEEASGSTVPAEIETYFLIPLKLENTFVSEGENPPIEYSITHPWVDADGDGDLEDMYGIPLTWKASLTHPVMFSTAEDLARWFNILYHDKNVVSSNSLAEMLIFPEVEFTDPDGNRFGLGVVDYSTRLGIEAFGHAGSALGYSAAALYLPEYEVSLVWLINTGESPAELGQELMSRAATNLIDVIRMNSLNNR